MNRENKVIIFCKMEIYKNRQIEDLPNEKWRDVVGYEGLYQVSNLGRVKSLYNNMIMSLFLSFGYLVITLCKNKKHTIKKSHRLVAQAFIPNHDNKRTVNHKNGVKTDNQIDNLEWCTHSENHKHAYIELGRKPSKGMLGKRGIKCKLSKPIIQLDLQGNFIREFAGQCEAERITGILQSHISQVCRGKRNHSGGFIWKYKDNQNYAHYYLIK